MRMTFIKVWNKQGNAIGKFEVPDSIPTLVRYNNKTYQYNTNYGVYIEAPELEPHQINSLWKI